MDTRKASTTKMCGLFGGANLDGGLCGGALAMVGRPTAIEIADRFEQIGAEAWLRGQRRP